IRSMKDFVRSRIESLRIWTRLSVLFTYLWVQKMYLWLFITVFGKTIGFFPPTETTGIISLRVGVKTVSGMKFVGYLPESMADWPDRSVFLIPLSTFTPAQSWAGRLVLLAGRLLRFEEAEMSLSACSEMLRRSREYFGNL